MTNAAQRYGKSRGRTAEKVKIALAAAGMSQSKAAREIGITQSNMNQICTGKSVPAWGAALALARLLGKRLDEIADLDEIEARWREERDSRAATATAQHAARATRAVPNRRTRK